MRKTATIFLIRSGRDAFCRRSTVSRSRGRRASRRGLRCGSWWTRAGARPRLRSRRRAPPRNRSDFGLLTADQLFPPVPRNPAPTQIEPARHLVSARVFVVHPPSQLAPDLVREPCLAVQVGG